MYEEVYHPKHYNLHPTGIECIDVIEEMTLNIGNAVKYLWRTGLKPGVSAIKDLDKAIWYIEREKNRLIQREQDAHPLIAVRVEGLEDLNAPSSSTDSV